MAPIQDPTTHQAPYVTVAELAAYWRVTERTIHYQITKGALKALRVGRVIRIKTEDARQFGRIVE